MKASQSEEERIEVFFTTKGEEYLLRMAVTKIGEDRGDRYFVNGFKIKFYFLVLVLFCSC